MNPELPKNHRDEMEQRLTALLLGELSAEEAAALHRAMEQDGELAKLFARLHHTVGLVRETVTSPSEPASAQAAPAKLSAARREKLLAHFKTITPKEFTPEKRGRKFTLVELAAALAIIAVLAAMLLPALSTSKSRRQLATAVDGAEGKFGRHAPRTEPAAQPAPAPTGVAFGTWDSAPSQERLGYDVNRSEALTDDAPSVVEAEAAAKRPSAITPLPRKPSSPIVLPPPAANYGYFDGSGVAGEGKMANPASSRTIRGDPEWVGVVEKPALPHSTTNSFITRYAGTANPPPSQGGDNFRYYLDLNRNPAFGPATGLPIATPEAGAVQSQGQSRAYEDLNNLAFAPRPPVAVVLSKPESSGGTLSIGGTGSLVTNSTLAGQDGFYRFGGMGGGGGRGGISANAGAVIVQDLAELEAANEILALTPPEVDLKARFAETTQNENKAFGFDWYLGSKLNTGKDALAEQDGTTISAANQPLDLLNRGTVTTFSGRSGGANVANGTTTLEDLTRLERRDTDSDKNDVVAPSLLPDGGRIAAAPNVYSLDAVGYADVPTQTAASAGIAINESTRRLRSSIVLPGLTTSTETRLSLVADEEKKPVSDHLLIAELRRKDASVRRLRESPQQLQKDRANVEKQRELERLGEEIEPTDLPIRKPATNAPIPQPEIQTSENNFSTFSLNVSDVSFKLAAASLEQGQMPDAASVRSEEFINAFDYRDPEPAAGAPIAFAYERARYPFAHNRDLLRFSLKTAAAGRQAGRPLNIVLLLDNSGSMERADRVQIIREALRVLAAQLQPQDKLSVIMFARTARLVADGIAGNQAGEVAEQVSGITPQGGTNLEDAMNLAYQTAARHYLANGINRVVLLTDGAANLGDVEPDSLKQKVEAQRQQGIALDCFGIGWEGLNDDLLEVLSRNGDGRYGFINSPEEAATDFVGQLAGALQVAASDVKVQVEFNPKRVTMYRQIGYAKHQLTKEQFRDNTVDAAEIAAQEAGNALYTVEVNPAGAGPLCTVRVRYKVPGTTDYREQAWDVPYTGNALSLEQASPAMRLAASASAFSEWLAVSPHAGEVRPDALLNLLNGVPEAFGADSRPKKLEWMIRQAKSLEGK